VLRGDTLEVFVMVLTSQLWLHLRVDAAGALYGATVAGLWLPALVYSIGFVRTGPRRRYFGFLMACLACTLGVAYAGNLFTLFIFYELAAVLTYASSSTRRRHGDRSGDEVHRLRPDRRQPGARRHDRSRSSWPAT
jgi:formate hydrogenlyase subunit 3/multisubunit Na+/H+ antiporter MnhD subunit